MTSVFIMCAGDGARWNDYLGVPKQLLTVCSETLVDRMARQVQEHMPARMYLVSRASRLIPSGRCESIVLDTTTSLVESIAQTSPHWSDRNIFLLGDVFFTDRAMTRLAVCDKDVAFFGRPWPSVVAKCGHGELFGMTFSAGARGKIEGLLGQATAAVTNGLKGNMWNLYQLAAGALFGTSPYAKHILVLLDDLTNDIDTCSDYLARGSLFQMRCGKGSCAPTFSLTNPVVTLTHIVGLIRWALYGSTAIHPGAFQDDLGARLPSRAKLGVDQ